MFTSQFLPLAAKLRAKCKHDVDIPSVIMSFYLSIMLQFATILYEFKTGLPNQLSGLKGIKYFYL